MHKLNTNKFLVIKDMFKYIFILMVIILITLPFATTFNEFLTKIVENTGFYKIIQKFIVPYMSSIVAGVLNHLPGISVKTFSQGLVINGTDVRIAWNCLGWQSFVLLFASFVIGLRGSFTRSSVFQTVILGLLGTFIINIFRMVFIAALVGWWRGLFIILFHNYFMTFVSIIWLFVFWWFSYKFILEDN